MGGRGGEGGAGLDRRRARPVSKGETIRKANDWHRGGGWMHRGMEWSGSWALG